MEKLADMLGFSSKAAKEFIIGCGNHHIYWQILRIGIAALGAELFRIYVINCKKSLNQFTLHSGKRMWLIPTLIFIMTWFSNF